MYIVAHLLSHFVIGVETATRCGLQLSYFPWAVEAMKLLQFLWLLGQTWVLLALRRNVQLLSIIKGRHRIYLHLRDFSLCLWLLACPWYFILYSCLLSPTVCPVEVKLHITCVGNNLLFIELPQQYKVNSFQQISTGSASWVEPDWYGFLQVSSTASSMLQHQSLGSIF